MLASHAVAPRILVLMGSGETAPTMIKPHRAVFERLGPDPVPAVILDTPYGFQENADDISARAVDYFASSVGRSVAVASLRRRETDDALGHQRAIAQVAAARWVFAGPGSPTYSLRQWRGGEVPALLADKLAHGGCVSFASAAALTLGRYGVPVYEIYKSGDDPYWADALDLVEPWLGPNVAIIPHYDNAEGGNHDTRFCYLGERRLRILEDRLPDDGWVLGVDEHTGCVIDIEAATATVTGLGSVTVRRRGRDVVVPAGTTVSIGELQSMARGKGGSLVTHGTAVPSTRGAGDDDADGRHGGSIGAGRAANTTTASATTPTADAVATASDATPLHAEIRRIEGDFNRAVAASDVDGAVRTVLELDDTLEAWSGDTTQSDAGDRARAALRRMVVALGTLAARGAQDPREVLAPYVDALLAERAAARADRRFADADRIRDALVAASVEVRDTPAGTEWAMGPAR